MKHLKSTDKDTSNSDNPDFIKIENILELMSPNLRLTLSLPDVEAIIKRNAEEMGVSVYEFFVSLIQNDIDENSANIDFLEDLGVPLEFHSWVIAQARKLGISVPQFCSGLPKNFWDEIKTISVENHAPASKKRRRRRPPDDASVDPKSF